MPTRKPSVLERKFSLYWLAVKGPKLEAEFKFCESRRWKSDFCHVASKTLIELEGGLYINGGHSRGAAYEKNLEKYNEAQFLGYHLFRLGPNMITVKNLERIRDFLSK